uniref:Uncharacterized protein n=1 Tax=Panagrellus redivivus TaxID=6233 RepID=A0A7E4ZQJ6_PANRE
MDRSLLLRRSSRRDAAPAHQMSFSSIPMLSGIISLYHRILFVAFDCLFEAKFGVTPASPRTPAQALFVDSHQYPYTLADSTNSSEYSACGDAPNLATPGSSSSGLAPAPSSRPI